MKLATYSYHFEIGMPHTGQNHLAEVPFIMQMGNMRWLEVSRISGIPSSLMLTEDGNPIYFTFYYIEENFSRDFPISSCKLNGYLRTECETSFYGKTMIDGFHYIYYTPPPSSLEEIGKEMKEIKVAKVRLSNIIVAYMGRASNLEINYPKMIDYSKFNQLDNEPDSYYLIKSAKINKTFREINPLWKRLSDIPLQVQFKINPDRDLNAAGLLYFANYITAFDFAEREFLTNYSKIKFTDRTIDSRSLVNRQIGYYGNADSYDTLIIEIEGFLEEGLLDSLIFHFKYNMRRKSDDKLIAISNAEKIAVKE